MGRTALAPRGEIETVTRSPRKSRTAAVAIAVAALLAMAGGIASAAHAQEGAAGPSDEGKPGRYTMTPTEDGVLRLDSVTGRVSHCRRKGAGWACTAAADDRAAYREEIERLEAENESLRRRIAALEKKGAGKVLLPSDEEIDRVMGFFERLMRRFFDFARSMRDSLGEDQT